MSLSVTRGTYGIGSRRRRVARPTRERVSRVEVGALSFCSFGSWGLARLGLFAGAFFGPVSDVSTDASAVCGFFARERRRRRLAEGLGELASASPLTAVTAVSPSDGPAEIDLGSSVDLDSSLGPPSGSVAAGRGPRPRPPRRRRGRAPVVEPLAGSAAS
jgi:hypothetical protein